jgi:hypothetical protein
MSFPKSKSGPHLLTFEHTEYLCDISPAITDANLISTGFPQPFADPAFMQLKTFGLNPGSQKTFPFLSQLACNFEEYSFDYLRFEYRSLIDGVMTGTNAQLGLVIMAVNYDATDVPWCNKIQMTNQEGSQSFKPTANVVHEVQLRHNPLKHKYVWCGQQQTGADIKFSDIGYFGIIAVQTTQPDSTFTSLGELYISYKVRFYKERLYATLGYTNKVWHLSYTKPGTVWGTATTSGNFSPSPSLLTVSANSNLNVDYSRISGPSGQNWLVMPVEMQGNYLVILQVAGTIDQNSIAPILNYSNEGGISCTANNIFTQSGGSTLPASATSLISDNACEVVYSLTVEAADSTLNLLSGPPQIWTFTNWQYNTNQTSFDLIILQIGNLDS